jgi:hypothetical protein
VAYIGNSPQETTVLRLEARKSFALSVWVRDANGRPLDISTTTLRLVMKKHAEDASNLITNELAEIVDAAEGFARFNLQATDLNHAAAEYPFALVLDADGYSTVAAKGIVDLQQNTDYTSLNSSYLPANAPAGVTLHVGEQSSLTLVTGPTLAPGTTSFTDGDKAKLDGIEPGAQANVTADWFAEEGQQGFIMNRPLFGTAAYRNFEDLLGLPKGGAPGEVLVKLSSTNYDVVWQQPASSGGGSTLPAAGVTAGYVPMATGAGGWSWSQVIAGVQSVNGQQGAVALTLNDLTDTETRVAMTPEERAQLNGLQSISYTGLTDLPVLGTASSLNTEQVLQPGGVTAEDVTTGVFAPERIPSISSLPGFRSGPDAPSGGFDGELYFQYT